MHLRSYIRHEKPLSFAADQNKSYFYNPVTTQSKMYDVVNNWTTVRPFTHSKKILTFFTC